LPRIADVDGNVSYKLVVVLSATETSDADSGGYSVALTYSDVDGA
jgi:hypothetical protein